MKHLLSALFFLLISGAPQLAAEPAAFDELAMASELDSGLQNDGNQALLWQLGSEQQLHLTQQGELNQARLLQQGWANELSLSQVGDENWVNGAQLGEGNSAELYQAGINN
ncbi:MAG: curlin, partial [Aeromonas veronii]